MNLARHLLYPQDTFRALGLLCSQHACAGGWERRTYGTVDDYDGPCDAFVVWVRFLDRPGCSVWFPVLEVPTDAGERIDARAATVLFLASLLVPERAGVIAREGWTP